MHVDSEFELSELVVGSGTVGKTVTKKEVLDLGFCCASEFFGL